MNFSFQKQPPMRKVILALLPIVILSIYFYGWYVLFVDLLSIFTAVVTEWLFVKNKKNGKISEAAVVTGLLLALTLPPTIPSFIVVIASSFAIVFGKMAFGGFGFNIFNPALVGRAFVYIAFPSYLTNRWMAAADFKNFPGGFAFWHYLPEGSSITSATPLIAFREGASNLNILDKLLLGNINGSFQNLGSTIGLGGGSIGESSAILIIIAGLYLIIKKIANWKPVVAFLGSYFVFNFIFHIVSPLKVPDPLFGILSGGILFGAFFMITDPVSLARTTIGQGIYGIFVGFFTFLIRFYSLFPDGVMFAILLGNMFNPLVDYIVNSLKK